MKNIVIKVFILLMFATFFIINPRGVFADNACGTGINCPAGATYGYNNYGCAVNPNNPALCIEPAEPGGVGTCQIWGTSSNYCFYIADPAGCTSMTAPCIADPANRTVPCCPAAPPPPPVCNPDCGNTGDHCSGETYSDGCTANACTGTKDCTPSPTCCGASFPSCINPGSSFTVTANCVNNATQVKFPTWSSANGQDDIRWYTSGAPWQVSIPQSSHPGGDINVHVYMDNSRYTNVWCDGRSIPLCACPQCGTPGNCYAPYCSNNGCGCTPTCNGGSGPTPSCTNDLGCGCHDASCSGGTSNPAPTCTANSGCGCHDASCSGGTANPAASCNGCLSGCCTSASCGGGNCVPPANGVCNTWSGWSACSSCSQTRTRTYSPPSCGGSNVSCPLSESQACGDVNGVCGAAHYSCSVGTSTNNVDGASAWTWRCNGSCAGSNPSCTENKPTAWCTVSPNPLPNSGNPGITLYSTNAYYCYVEHDWSLVREGYFTSGTYYPGAQTVAGNHQGEVYCYNSNWNGSGWNTCNYTVNPPPSCTVSIPADTVKIGETRPLTATTTQAYGTISKVDFSSNNGNATVSPATDTASPYATAVTGISTGTSTITGTATVSNGIITGTCTDTATITIPACTVSLAPAAKTLTVGDVFAFVANLTNIFPSSVSFSSNTPGSVSVNPASDTTSPYTTNATAVSPTGATLTASAIYNGVAKCSGTSTISVNAKSWWQVKNGDVTTNGDISSIVPPTTVLYFDTIGAGGYPGIPAYGGTTNLNGANVSATGWLAASGYNATKIYNSAYFLNAKPSDVTPKQIGPSITSADFDFKAANSWYGYYWYEYDGTNPITINGNIDFGTKKVILLVKQTNVTLNGKINLTDGQGFFMLAVGGNITIDPNLGGTPPQAAPNLEGIFISDGQFQTGTTASGTDPQLWIRGTVAAYEAVSLQRFLGSANLTTPAELFEYAPDLDLLFPGILGARTMNWREVAP